MRIKPNLSNLSLLLLVVGAPSHAALIAYWNMDAGTVSGKLAANGGSQAGSISSSFVETSIGYHDEIKADVSGTTINLSGSEGDPNRAVEFYRAGTFYGNGYFLMERFDFTGLSGVEISFAYDSFAAFSWNENLNVEYRINDGIIKGDWEEFDEEKTWTNGYVLAEVALPTAIVNESDVDLRIRTESWGSAIGWLKIDNVQVTAVPEISLMSMGTGMVTLLAAGLFRRRRTRG